MLKVAKFGGTSVADSLQIEKIKSIVEADGDRRYIVAKNAEFEKYKSSAIAFSWFVWEVGYAGVTELRWIK